MAITAAVTAAVSATVGVAGAVENAHQQHKAQDKENEAAQLQQAQAAADNARKRRQAIAQQRIQLGQVNNNAAVSGTQGSSGAIGGAGALYGDSQSGLAQFDSQINTNANANQDLSQASAHAATASLFGTVGQIGTQLGSFTPAYKLGEKYFHQKGSASFDNTEG